MTEEVSKPAAWHSSWPVLLAASILLPPVGLALVWMRRDFDLPLKAISSVMLVALTAGYVYFIFGEDHDAALERHRAQQRQSVPAGGAEGQTPGAQAPPGAAGEAPAAAATVVDPAALAAAGANGAGAQGQPAAEQTAAAPGAGATSATGGARRNYWTNFRGPGRDGRYAEASLKSNLGGGLPLLWRQPVGGGYASF